MISDTSTSTHHDEDTLMKIKLRDTSIWWEDLRKGSIFLKFFSGRCLLIKNKKKQGSRLRVKFKTCYSVCCSKRRFFCTPTIELWMKIWFLFARSNYPRYTCVSTSAKFALFDLDARSLMFKTRWKCKMPYNVPSFSNVSCLGKCAQLKLHQVWRLALLPIISEEFYALQRRAVTDPPRCSSVTRRLCSPSLAPLASKQLTANTMYLLWDIRRSMPAAVSEFKKSCAPTLQHSSRQKTRQRKWCQAVDEAKMHDYYIHGSTHKESILSRKEIKPDLSHR